MNELEQLGERIAEQAAHLDAAMHRLLADPAEVLAPGSEREATAADSASHAELCRIDDSAESPQQQRVAESTPAEAPASLDVCPVLDPCSIDDSAESPPQLEVAGSTP
ncbi:MAG TPA: hypothetical protein VF516_27730, partial [Kofleriaceae bacterium]